MAEDSENQIPEEAPTPETPKAEPRPAKKKVAQVVPETSATDDNATAPSPNVPATEEVAPVAVKTEAKPKAAICSR